MVRATPDPLKELTGELENFQSIARHIMPLPGEIPDVNGMDIYGDTIPLTGITGGDHIIYVDFKKRFDLAARIAQAAAAGRSDVVANLERCRRMAGIAVIDVAGHHATDAMLAAMLHQAFLLGSLYELDMFGHITRRLFENLNTRFHHSSSLRKFVTMIYGEISEDASFRFISAAHPVPLVFSNHHDRFMQVSTDFWTSFPPIGTLPSNDVIDRGATHSVLGFKEQYQVNEWRLMGSGDILLLCTDGLLEHGGVDTPFFPDHLERTLRRVKHESARRIFEEIRKSTLEYAAPTDDISAVVIKRL